MDIKKTRYKKDTLIQNHLQHVHSESTREQRIALYKLIKAMNNSVKNLIPCGHQLTTAFLILVSQSSQLSCAHCLIPPASVKKSVKSVNFR